MLTIEKKLEYEETCHAPNDSFSIADAFLIDSGASKHMVASRESFSSLQYFDGPSIQMGNNSKIQAKGKGSINLEHGKFKYVLYEPSLAANLLAIYQMTHSGSPKRLIFGPDSVEITNISTGNIIAKGVANHNSKEYEFSHFMPFSEPVHSQLPLERGGKNILSTPFAILTSILESEAKYSVVSVYEIEVQGDSDPNPVPTPNPKPKWAHKAIGEARKMTGNTSNTHNTRD